MARQVFAPALLYLLNPFRRTGSFLGIVPSPFHGLVTPHIHVGNSAATLHLSFTPPPPCVYELVFMVKLLPESVKYMSDEFVVAHFQ